MGVSGNSLVIEVPSDNRPEPLPLPTDRLMAISPENLSDCFELGPHLLGDGLSTCGNAPVASAFRTVMGEPEEVEGFRLPLTSLLAVCDCEAPEFDESGLLFVQFETEFRQSLDKVGPKPLRIGSVLESQDEVIRQPHDIDFAACVMASPPLHP